MGLIEEYLNNRWGDRDDLLGPMLEAWTKFESLGIADNDFETEFSSKNEEKFFQRLWEMNLGLYLSQLGYEVRSSASGPDFKILHDGNVIWIEAVCPTPSGLPLEYIKPEMGVAISVPSKEILLRWTSGLIDKKKKFDKYLEDSPKATRIVNKSDINVIAINGCQLGSHSDFGITQYPFIVEATLPIGPFQVHINRETLKKVGSGHSFRDTVCKANGANVPTDNFLNPDFANISAVIGCVNHVDMAIGRKSFIYLVHNPNATNPLPRNILGADIEYVVEDDGETISITKFEDN